MKKCTSDVSFGAIEAAENDEDERVFETQMVHFSADIFRRCKAHDAKSVRR
jgi:hypothetical protein